MNDDRRGAIFASDEVIACDATVGGIDLEYVEVIMSLGAAVAVHGTQPHGTQPVSFVSTDGELRA